MSKNDYFLKSGNQMMCVRYVELYMLCPIDVLSECIVQLYLCVYILICDVIIYTYK